MATHKIVRGDYEVIQATIQEPDPASPGQYRNRNISSDTFRFTAKRSLKDPSAFIEKDSGPGGGITKTDAAQGAIEISILPEDTASMSKPGQLFCDIQGTDSSDRPYTSFLTLQVLMDIST